LLFVSWPAIFGPSKGGRNVLAGLFVALLLLILIGAPVLCAIGSVALLGIVLIPEIGPAIFPQKMFAMVDSFSLLALPYFILAGELMTAGGMSRKLVSFAETVVGHLRGGLGHASVVACIIFANVSGSAVASTSAIGSILAPAMKEKGYKPGFSASLLGTAGIIGSIIPPSMVMIVYGSLTGVSIGRLFLAGIIPGLLISAALMGTIYAHSFRAGFGELRQTSSFSLSATLREIPRVWVALFAPVIILGGILGGIFTATEAGVIACLYAFVVTFFVYRSLALRQLPGILLNAAVTTATVVGIIAVAGAFGWLMTFLDFNELVFSLLVSFSQNPLVVLLILVAVMLFLTMFVEGLAVLVIIVPVIVFVSQHFNFDPIHLGMVMVIATQVGSTTPPVAVGLFVATSVVKASYDQTLRYCLPFVLALMLVLLLVVLIPVLSTWIPNYFLGPE
jgi:tripartite ATP-independent transporter DctM subunit